MAGLVTASAAVSGRASPPADRLHAARSAVGQSRLGPAARWAPNELATAAAALSEAEVAYAREAARLWLWRDFTGVATRLWSAEIGARAAHRMGEVRRIAARTDTAGVLQDATGLLAAAESLAARTSLPREERVHLARARLLISEARALAKQEEYRQARRAAELGHRELIRAVGPALERARRYTSADRVATWKQWIQETRSWSRATGRFAIVVLKEKNELTLLDRGRAVRTYPVDIGSNALGRKLRAGDLATPEGRYRVVAKKGPGQSRYHRALLLDYPNEADRRRIAEARRAGELPPGSRPGGLIEIHGEGGLGRNWTDGCVAVSNADIDEIFAKVELGARVTIVGGDGTNGAFSGFAERFAEERQ